MGKVKVDHLQRLLQALSEKTRLELSVKDLQTISEEVGFKNIDYLYKKIYIPIQKKRKNDTIGLHTSLVDKAAQYLKYKDFRTFVESVEQGDPQMMSLVGNYYCYVRRNSEKERYILRSPVKIEQRKDGKIEFQLKGPAYIFKGDIHSRHGCIFVLMKADEGKLFHHIYKVGERQSPSVLQGVFSGVSTAFDPIGGRTVLVRTEEPYASLTNASLSVAALLKSKSAVEKRLAIYFKEYANNNIAPKRSSTFGFEDL
jgi:hypothetical protein